MTDTAVLTIDALKVQKELKMKEAFAIARKLDDPTTHFSHKPELVMEYEILMYDAFTLADLINSMNREHNSITNRIKRFFTKK